MAKTKSKKSSKLGRDSNAQYLGVKLFGGQKIKIGQVIIRQRGTKFLPGINVKKARDNTLYAIGKGIVQFRTIRKRKFDNSQKKSKIVNVVPEKIKK